MHTIAIPTYKTKEEIQPLIDKIRLTTDAEIIASCIRQSAAKNRNWCIDNSHHDKIIMIDDDIDGFYKGWDYDLIMPFKNSIQTITSARLIKQNGEIAPQLGAETVKDSRVQFALHSNTGLNITCSACIAFDKSAGIRFDEKYLSATYEDSDFCMSYNSAFIDKCVYINNNVKLIHHNHSSWHQVGQKGDWLHNKQYFAKKWGVDL